MRKNLFTTVLMLTMTMAMIAAMGISNVSAQPPHPEIVVRPTLHTGPQYTYHKYEFSIKNAPHHDLEGVSPDSYSKTWAWQIELNWDPTVLMLTSTAKITENTTYALLNYFQYYEWTWIVEPLFGEWNGPFDYPRSGLTISFDPSVDPGKLLIGDGLIANPDPATIETQPAGADPNPDPDVALHSGDYYDLPYSEGISDPGYHPNELHLFNIEFVSLKAGPPYATPITVNMANTYFWCHDVTTVYHVSAQEAWFGVIGPHLHSTGSPIPDPSNPVGTSWHELYPNYSYEYDLIQFRDDNGDGVLSYCDEILLHPTEPAGADLWYHVEEVTITIFVNKKDEAGDPTGETMYIDLELPADVLPDEVYTPIKEPICTQWHELYPDYCRRYHLTDWEDTGPDNPGELGVSDQIWLTDKETGEAAEYHVDDVCTDIIVTPEPDKIVPEFPLGIGLMIAIAPAIPIVYLWRTRKKEK